MAKIQEYENETNEFIFPNNPQIFSDEFSSNNEITLINYSNFHVGIGNKTLQPLIISATGNLVLNNKYQDFNTLSNMINDSSKIKKLYFKDDRFYFFIGNQIKKTHTNVKTNFIDYVFSGTAIIPLSFSDTLHTSSYNGSTWTNGNQTNEGGTYTYIEEVQITLSANASSGSTITFNSSNESGITYTLNNSVSSGSVLTIKMLRFESIGSGIKNTKYWNMHDSNNNQQNKAKASNKDELALCLNAGERIDTYSISTSGITYSNITFKFRNAYYGG